MTIAGSDSGGGAGLQADLKTFAALGVFGTSVVTAVTAQNTKAVLGVVALEPSMVDLQIEALIADLPVAAVKTGMLANAAIIECVARRAAAGELPNLVVDPVMVTATGTPLLDEAGVRAYLENLLPLAELVTPNIREAAILTGRASEDLCDVEEMASAAEILVRRGARSVLVKGGHLRSGRSPDVLLGSGCEEAAGPLVLDAPRVDSGNDHGTGCTLAAAIAASLATGCDLKTAVVRAKSFVTGAIEGASGWRLGRGHGPLDHLGWGPRSPRPELGLSHLH